MKLFFATFFVCVFSLSIFAPETLSDIWSFAKDMIRLVILAK